MIAFQHQGLLQKAATTTATATTATTATTTATTTSSCSRRLSWARTGGALYVVSGSVVLVWRGTWMLWDIVYESICKAKPTDPGHAGLSGLLSHGTAAVGLLGCGLLASVLAPPAAVCVLRDAALRGTKKQQSHCTTASAAAVATITQPKQRPRRLLDNNRRHYHHRRKSRNFRVRPTNKGLSSSTGKRGPKPRA